MNPFLYLTEVFLQRESSDYHAPTILALNMGRDHSLPYIAANQFTSKCRGPSKWAQSYLFRLTGLFDRKSIRTRSHLPQKFCEELHALQVSRHHLTWEGMQIRAKEIAFLGSPEAATHQYKTSAWDGISTSEPHTNPPRLPLTAHLNTCFSLHAQGLPWRLEAALVSPRNWQLRVGHAAEQMVAGKKRGLFFIAGACFTQKPNLGFLQLVLGNNLAFRSVLCAGRYS